MFAGSWPYAHPTGGRVEDLDRAEFAWIKAFHDQYYGPNNAVLAVAGRLDIEATKGLIHKYFDTIPRVVTPPYVEPPPLPEPRGPRDETMKDPALGSPGLLYGWAIPPNNHPDHYPLTLASKLLGMATLRGFAKRWSRRRRSPARSTSRSTPPPRPR